jgi:hypothetical protein
MIKESGMKRTLNDLLETWGLKSLKINTAFLEATFEPSPEDKEAAWEMYIELITRVSTQHLLPNHGDEKAALASIYSLFETTRKVLKDKGRKCEKFTQIAVIVLNQIIRPFTSKWHKISLNEGFNEENSEVFRAELMQLQESLRKYTKLLSDLAGVEDLTELECE